MYRYIYFLIYLYYLKNKDSIPHTSAVIIVATLQFMNLLSAIFLFYLLTNTKFKINKLWIILGLVTIVSLNQIYFKKNNFIALEKFWVNETKKNRITNGIIIICYLLISFISCFGLAIFLGKQK